MVRICICLLFCVCIFLLFHVLHSFFINDGFFFSFLVFLHTSAPPLKLIDLPGLDQRIVDDSMVCGC